MRYLLLLLALCWTAHGANPSFGDFDPTQFRTNGNKLSVKSGPTLTNLNDTGTTLTRSLTVSNALPLIELWNTSGSANAKRFRLIDAGDHLSVQSVSDDGLTITLLGYFDSTGFHLSGALTADSVVGTNGLRLSLSPGIGWVLRSMDALGNGQWTTNLDVLNITNLTIVNSFTIKGKVVSFSSANGTNVSQLNLKDTATVTWGYDGGSNVTATATSSGDTTATNIVQLTQTGTNASQLDFSLVARGGVFKLQATNNVYFGAPANANNTDFKHGWLVVQQPSTGTCLVTFTNGFFAMPEGGTSNPLINDTNANAVVWYEWATDPITNGVVNLWMSTKMAR